MRQVFLDDLESDKRALHELRLGRDFLSELLVAINSRIENRAEKVAAPDVRRLGGYTVSPNLAPFDVAKLNGTAALLPGERLRLFNRIAFALELLANVRRDLYAAMDRLAAFHIRYVDSRGSIQAGESVPGPDLDRLTAAELQEYRATVATLAKGYRNPVDPDPFAEASWFRTNDLGAIDDAGVLTVLGRADDAISTGGLTVLPQPVEAALGTHPAVRDCAVFGVADDRLGQRVVAAIVLRDGWPAPTLEALRTHVGDTLDATAAPRELQIIDALPRRGIGKVDRAALAHRFAADQ